MRPRTTEARVRSQASACEVCGGKVLSVSILAFVCQYHSTIPLRTQLLINANLIRRTSGRNLRALKSSALSENAEGWIEMFFHKRLISTLRNLPDIP
jgi:hypothetical protein